jgi:predicted AlkP superfamily phosphohydrolase/phosphomutase
MGNVYVNVHGREPEGIVPRGREYERLRDRLAEDLAALRDPEDGKPLCDHVYRREELYWGPAFDMAPDLLVRMRNYACTTRGACEFLGESLTSPPVVNHTGNHRLDGILIARGPDFATGRTVEGASLVDLAPTILYGRGVAVPIGTDGQVIENLYNIEFLRAHRIERSAAGENPPGVGSDSGLSDQEAALVRERLRALGYLT